MTDITLPRLPVLDSFMAWRGSDNRAASGSDNRAASGGGDATGPVALFLHGNPTSSYIWRNVMKLVAPVARCVAPDLIGFGQSGKPDIDYRFTDQARYLDAFIAASGITSAYLVAQDWGTALAFHLAARRPDFVRGLAFMEFIRPVARWEDFHQSEAARALFRRFRTPGEGERLILEENAFLERLHAGTVTGRLTEADMAVYRAPFPTPQSRKPVWRLPNELPIAGEPADVTALLTEAHAALAAAPYPKLLFAGDPGSLVTPAFAEQVARNLKTCRLVHLGPGAHHLQEDHPEAIGRAVAEWISEIEAAQPQKDGRMAG